MSDRQPAFPSRMPAEKPQDRSLSKATERFYDLWTPSQDRGNEFYTLFKYSPVTGIGKESGVSRRDPSKVLKFGDTYYVWYTRRQTDVPPVGRHNIEDGDDTTPVVDWDLAEIAYATSKDGLRWEEQGIAVGRASKDTFGDRSLSTPDVLVFKGKYYLYYQTFQTMWRPNDCVSVSMAWAESPDGPWTRVDRPVIPRGDEGEWDSCAIHDPYPLVYKGKVWLFYKGTPTDKSAGALMIAHGVAIADDPMGPYVKSPLNPITNSGHETMLWPYKEGIASLLILDGPEKDTIQYAPDGLNFEPKAHIQLLPKAGGPFCPDAFADNGDGRGITWGLSHINADRSRGESDSFIIRFDCDLSCDVDRSEFKQRSVHFNENTWLQPVNALPEDLRQRIQSERASLDRETIIP